MTKQHCYCCGGEGCDDYGPCPLCDGRGLCDDDDDDDDTDAAATQNLLSSDLLRRRSQETFAYSVRAAEHKGHCLHTDCALRLGDLILVEKPLLSVAGTEALRAKVMADNYCTTKLTCISDLRQANEVFAKDERLTRAVARAFSKADTLAQTAFLELSDSFFVDGSLGPGVWVQLVVGTCGFIVESKSKNGSDFFVVDVDGELVQDIPRHQIVPRSRGTLGGIFLTNAVDEAASDVSHVYAVTSRINHSCRPNAIATTQDSMRCILAARDIQAGDEISISYIQDYRKDRHHAEFCQRVEHISQLITVDAEALLVGLFRQQLFVKWGFWCHCKRCAQLAEMADIAVQRWESF